MNRRVKTHRSFLELLHSTSDKQRKAIINTITKAQLDILCEIVLNFYRGTFDLNQYQIKKVLPYRRFIETFISKTVGKRVKQRALIRNQRIIPTILLPLLKLKRNGGGDDADTKSEISEDVTDESESDNDDGSSKKYAELRTIDDFESR